MYKTISCNFFVLSIYSIIIAIWRQPSAYSNVYISRSSRSVKGSLRRQYCTLCTVLRISMFDFLKCWVSYSMRQAIDCRPPLEGRYCTPNTLSLTRSQRYFKFTLFIWYYRALKDTLPSELKAEIVYTKEAVDDNFVICFAPFTVYIRSYACMFAYLRIFQKGIDRVAQ